MDRITYPMSALERRKTAPWGSFLANPRRGVDIDLVIFKAKVNQIEVSPRPYRSRNMDHYIQINRSGPVPEEISC